MKMLVIIVFIFLNSVHITYAEEKVSIGEGQIVIGANFTDENRYNLSVIVHEGGRVVDGKQNLRQGIVDYSLGLDTQKEFKIIANEGYDIKQVIFKKPKFNDVKDLTNELAESMIKLDIESTDMELEVSFEKSSLEPPPEGEQPGVDKPSVDKPSVDKPSVDNPNADLSNSTVTTGGKGTSDRPKSTSNVDTGDKNKAGIGTYMFILGLSSTIGYFVLRKNREDDSYKE